MHCWWQILIERTNHYFFENKKYKTEIQHSKHEVFFSKVRSGIDTPSGMLSCSSSTVVPRVMKYYRLPVLKLRQKKCCLMKKKITGATTKTKMKSKKQIKTNKKGRKFTKGKIRRAWHLDNCFDSFTVQRRRCKSFNTSELLISAYCGDYHLLSVSKRCKQFLT